MAGSIAWIEPVSAVVEPARFGSGHPMRISTMGDETPIYFPPGEVMDLLPGRRTATGSHAGTGFWLVARRS